MYIADKTYNITTNGTVILPVPANPQARWCLVRIIVNSKGASSNTATLYDSDEATGANDEQRIGKIDTTANVGHIDYGIVMKKGIYIVIATGTPPDLTVVYKEIS